VDEPKLRKKSSADDVLSEIFMVKKEGLNGRKESSNEEEDRKKSLF
jgi:hypothetical protein